MYILGAVVDKKEAKVALFDGAYQLLAKKGGAAAELSALCKDVMLENKLSASDVAYAGVAIDPSAENADTLASGLEKAIGVKCLGGALIAARALGEAYLTDDVSSLFLLKADETMEAGIVIDKKLYEGAHGRGGNVAHMVIDFGGFECACGNRGCFEAYASVAGLRKFAAQAGVPGADSITHAELFAMDTASAEQAKTQYVKYFAAGITNLINLFQLQEFVLDGPFSELGDGIMAPMMDIILREQFSNNMPNKCNVRFAKCKTKTALLGAALLGR